MKSKLQGIKINNLKELKEKLLQLWYSIPKILIEKLNDNFIKKLQLCQQYEGRRIDKQLLIKMHKNIKKVEFIDWEYNKEMQFYRIVYNNKLIQVLKNKEIKR